MALGAWRLWGGGGSRVAIGVPFRVSLGFVLIAVDAVVTAAVGQGTQQLPPIQVWAPATSDGGPPAVMTTAGPVSGYRALTATSATKTDTPIEHIPQTIQVVPNSVIRDQAALTHNEVLRNVAATSGMQASFFYGAGYLVRGFEADRFVDGLPLYIDGGDYTSLVNIERIEVVKGPGGLFFQSGTGITGGVINTISKLPTREAGYEAGLKAGSIGLVNPWFDVNQPLGAGALFRMTGEFETSRDTTEVIERRRYSINPTLRFTDDERTSLTIQGRASRRDQQFFVGLPATGTLDRSRFTLRPELYVGPADIPKSESENAGLTLRFDHAFDHGWSFQLAARYSEMRKIELAQTTLSNVPTFGTSFVLTNVATPWEAREISVSPALVAKFQAGDTSNTLLLGADYDRVTDSLSIWSTLAGVTDFARPSPVFPPYVNPTGIGVQTFAADTVNQNGGLTAQLQTSIRERLHLLLGLRWAMIDFVGARPFGGGDYHIAEGKLLPRLGAAYDVLPGVTPFIGYSEGLRTVRFFAGAGMPKPEEARQLEGGVKLALPSGFAATLALFDITRLNVVSTDPVNPFLQIQTGEQRSQGFDAAMTWHPLPGLSLLASYAHVEARVTQDQVLRPGTLLARVPRDSGRVWADCKIQHGALRNVTLGGGFYAASRQAIGLDNVFFTPGFITFDAKIGYETETWSLAQVGKNLTDQRYFIPYPYVRGRVAPAERLTVLAVASLRSR